MFGKCKECEGLKRENEYLKTLVDKLLMSQGVQPVSPQSETLLDDTDDDKEERARKEKGLMQYGN